MSTKTLFFAGVVTASLLAAACKENKPEVSTSTTTSAGVPAMSASQILEVTHYADMGEIAEAKLAQEKASDPRVKSLAADMLKERTETDQKAFDIAKKQDFQLNETLVSANMRDDADRTLADLRVRSGADFDKAYVDAQVAAEQQILEVIDTKLLSAAADPDVKFYLNEVRQSAVIRLMHAKHVQADLAKNQQP